MPSGQQELSNPRESPACFSRVHSPRGSSERSSGTRVMPDPGGQPWPAVSLFRPNPHCPNCPLQAGEQS